MMRSFLPCVSWPNARWTKQVGTSLFPGSHGLQLILQHSVKKTSAGLDSYRIRETQPRSDFSPTNASLSMKKEEEYVAIPLRSQYCRLPFASIERFRTIG